MSIEKYKNDFCNRVKELRKQRRIELVELAKCSGIPLEVLRQLEQNILPEEIGIEEAYALARVFRCKIHELFK